MRILVSGVSGFIGSRLFERLRTETQHEVFGLQRYVAGRTAKGNVFLGDICDGDVYRVVTALQPQIVLHLAALASNEVSNDFPVEAMRVNAVGTARLLRAFSECRDRQCFVLASSSEVYGFEQGPISETSPIRAKNPYAASKIAAEEAVRASGIPYVIMHCFNTYGRALINLPKFIVDETIHQALTTDRILLRDGSPRRDLLFREDHVEAYLAVVKHWADVRGESFNFGTGYAPSIADMAYMVAAMTGAAKPQFSNKPRPGDVDSLLADSRKAWERLGWKAQYSLEKGLEQAIKEWRQCLKGQQLQPASVSS